MQPELPPIEAHIRDCMEQLHSQQHSTYNETVQTYARLRLADFSALLAEWTMNNHLPHASPLPKVATALSNTSLTPTQIQSLLKFLQQAAKQGQRTAILYLAYLFAKGLGVKQSPQQAIQYAKKLSKQGDWRATRFCAELLWHAPKLTESYLSEEIQPLANAWWQQHINQIPTSQADQLSQSVQRFYAASSVVKLTIRRTFELAIKQGSPSAEKRLRGLTVLGELPISLPAKHFQHIESWLQQQFLTPTTHYEDDDIRLLPEHIPLLISHDEPEEKPFWLKLTIYACIMLIITLCFSLLVKHLFS